MHCLPLGQKAFCRYTKYCTCQNQGNNFEDILNDDSIDLVIEVLGGVEPGKEYIKSLLGNGKAVITANKDIIADCGNELVQLAQENNTCLYFEAAVAAGIPVLKPLIESLRGEDLN